MVWHTEPDCATVVRDRDLNYGLLAKADPARLTADLVRPYAGIFAYNLVASGNQAVLIEGLLRLETCNAGLYAAIPALWLDMTRNGLSFAEDADKQRLDRLYGLDGKTGLCGALRRYRLTTANELPGMSDREQGALLDRLFALADALLPDGDDTGQWSACAATYALPLYLQALALIVLVQGWSGGRPAAGGGTASARHVAFLTGAARSSAADVADVLDAAGQALSASY
jgi:hypothetical protein